MSAIRTLITLVCFVWTVFCTVSANGANSIYERFPDGQPCISPNGRYTIENVNRTDEPHHMLMLKDNVNNIRRKLYSYDREASIVWSADSQKLLLNDYAGSDYTENFILSVSEQKTTVDLKRVLIQKMTEKERPSATKNDHVYVSGIEWIGDSNVKLIVWGHGALNPDGFCKCYIYTVTEELRHCEKFELQDGVDVEDYCGQLRK